MKKLMIGLFALSSMSAFADYSATCITKRDGYRGFGISEETFQVEILNSGISIVEPGIAKVSLNGKEIIFDNGSLHYSTGNGFSKHYRGSEDQNTELTFQVKNLKKALNRERFDALVVLSGEILGTLSATVATEVECHAAVKL